MVSRVAFATAFDPKAEMLVCRLSCGHEARVPQPASLLDVPCLTCRCECDRADPLPAWFPPLGTPRPCRQPGCVRA